MTATEVAGFAGAGIAGAAYVPQIWHLIHERCSAGISRFAFGAWLVAAALLTVHAVASDDLVFIALGSMQIAASAVVLIAATQFKNCYCEHHLPAERVIR